MPHDLFFSHLGFCSGIFSDCAISLSLPTCTFLYFKCLSPLFACDGWDVTTVEHIGNLQSGLNPIQKQLADYNGSQCGYCTPGQVMNMYA